MDPFDNLYNMIGPLYDYDFPNDFAPINFDNYLDYNLDNETKPEDIFEIQLPKTMLSYPPKIYRPFKSLEQLENDVKEINKQLNN